ncbi:MAG TPA: phytanoyl-CoA dioxygenase family protein [Chthoniobacterales bacterium]|jgi:ectoine hydroxylase-related dioxygenase (phytanoyl-CoA dioxygenase family)|nr:phytanoyl-CoA dioxygenase family protein [Chthoniobacterales bacterium]
MAQICSGPPRSGGKILDNQDDVFGSLSDSSDSLANPAELRSLLESDGYLYLKRFFNPTDVLEIRKSILARMLEEDLVLPGTNPVDAKANPDRRTAFMPELAENNLALEKLIYGERVMTFYETLLEGPVLHYDFTWFRPVGPGRGTSPHCDLVYMGRGTPQVFTMWVPYGEVSLSLGGLMVLEGSHRKSKLLGKYLSRDVDSYCANRQGAEKAQTSDSFLWDGKLAKDPVSLRKKLGGRWLTAEFEAGDMITFCMTLVHASLDNQTDQIRLSSDSRYQLASEAVDNRWVGLHPVGHSRAGKLGRIC